jgi:hypothetical protein
VRRILPDLIKLDRYERRAAAQRDRAIRQIIKPAPSNEWQLRALARFRQGAPYPATLRKPLFFVALSARRGNPEDICSFSLTRLRHRPFLARQERVRQFRNTSPNKGSCATVFHN